MKSVHDAVMNYGKIPPQNQEIEIVVLGALMLAKDAYLNVSDMLAPEHFYADVHGMIYKAIVSLANRSAPVDIMTVTEELKRTEELEKVGGAYFITGLTNRVASAANIRYHATIIKEMWAKREVIRIGSDLVQKGFEDATDVFELLEKADMEISQTKEVLTGRLDQKDWDEQLDENMNVIEKVYRKEIAVAGIPTGNDKLDAITGGWQKTDLIYLCARPGMGKTSRVLNFQKYAMLNNFKCVMFSLEMGVSQIVRKFLNEQSEVFIRRMITGDMDERAIEKLRSSKKILSKLNFHLVDKSAVSPNYISTICKQRKKKHGLDMVVIDYVQLMSPNSQVRGRSRDGELSGISAALKGLAKDLNVVVIALAQLSRKCEERTDKRPMLSDLRESGSLEQDADIVMGIYRPSYYNELTNDKDYRDSCSEEEYKRMSELLLLKHRNGETDKFIKEKFYGELSRTVSQEVVVETEKEYLF